MDRVQRTHARTQSGTVVDARASLAMWLRAGRAQRNMTLEAVAKVTKIQSRILERLEAGKFEGLPAEVFVRGFIRSFARCVGLDEDEALKRYSACSKAEPPPSAKAFVESMSDLAPTSASNVTGFRATPIVLRDQPKSIDIDMDEPDQNAPDDDVVAGPAVAPSIEPAAEARVGTVRAEGSSQIDIAMIASLADDVAGPTEMIESIETSPSGSVEMVMLPEMGTLVSEPTVVPTSDETRTPIEAIAAGLLAELPETPKKKGRKAPAKRASRSKRKSIANGTPAEASPVVAAPDVIETAVERVALPVDPTELPTVAPTELPTETTMSDTVAADVVDVEVAGPIVEPIACAAASDPSEPAMAIDTSLPIAGFAESTADAATVESTSQSEHAVGGVWSPKMPAIAPTVNVPWRMSRNLTATTVAPVVPSLVIDDSDPDSAERELEDRAAEKSSRPRARSFLPPILLDREDRSARQGGLTLAVIILLIAATLTLSYLMRRPSSSGDGVTLAPIGDTSSQIIG